MVLIGKDPAAGSGDGVDRGGGLVSKCRAISESHIRYPFYIQTPLHRATFSTMSLLHRHEDRCQKKVLLRRKRKRGTNTYMSYMSLHVVLRSSCFTFRSIISLFHCNLLSDMNIMNHEHHCQKKVDSPMSAPLNHPRSLSSVTVPVPVPFPGRVRDLNILQLQRKRQLATTKRCGDVVVSFD